MQDCKQLNNSVGQLGYAQNESKQETISMLRNRQENRLNEQLGNRTQGVYLSQLKHVGGFLSPSNSNDYEISQRLIAANRGWNNMYGSWNAKAPKSTKRLVLGPLSFQPR